MSPTSIERSNIICHCLGVTEEDIRQAVTPAAIDRLQHIATKTGAGSACMACRRRILAMLNDQCPSSGCSPT